MPTQVASMITRANRIPLSTAWDRKRPRRLDSTSEFAIVLRPPLPTRANRSPSDDPCCGRRVLLAACPDYAEGDHPVRLVGALPLSGPGGSAGARRFESSRKALAS
jgi:hypothetical protein